jgi:cholesterol transport system auxiliary component
MKTKLTTAAALATVLLLGGCALLGGGGKRAQMYRFGASDAAPATAQAPVVQLNGLVFQRAAEGDRLLAVNGAEAFYIAQSRWVSPAQELFTQAVDRAFDRAGLDLIRRGQPQTPVANLNLTVPVFEARYLAGVESAPTVFVEVEAVMASVGGDRGPLGATRASASVPAARNTVPAIVAAYDAATRQTLDQVATWARTAATAGARPPAS